MTQKRWWKKRAETCAVSNRRNNVRMLVTLRSLSLSMDLKTNYGFPPLPNPFKFVFLFFRRTSLQTSLSIESLPGFSTAVSRCDKRNF
ncbi:hypothetical protein CEXT_58341 [Caerostris extrusa]|uniref:Uncharacterized protein n=1 Tax=Caerostris extrusa TaxID=172846 RepID=A0AAV4RX71_CAEEX|nr:hypothetical protein CEXT_58341 [Caerostris extrusa]